MDNSIYPIFTIDPRPLSGVMVARIGETPMPAVSFAENVVLPVKGELPLPDSGGCIRIHAAQLKASLTGKVYLSVSENMVPITHEALVVLRIPGTWYGDRRPIPVISGRSIKPPSYMKFSAFPGKILYAQEDGQMIALVPRDALFTCLPTFPDTQEEYNRLMREEHIFPHKEETYWFDGLALNREKQDD